MPESDIQGLLNLLGALGGPSGGAMFPAPVGPTPPAPLPTVAPPSPPPPPVEVPSEPEPREKKEGIHKVVLDSLLELVIGKLEQDLERAKALQIGTEQQYQTQPTARPATPSSPTGTGTSTPSTSPSTTTPTTGQVTYQPIKPPVIQPKAPMGGPGRPF